MVDDLHWADVSSVRLLQAVASAVAESRLLVLGLLRGWEVSRANLAGPLAEVRRERATAHLTLTGLTPPEVALLTRAGLGPSTG